MFTGIIEELGQVVDLADRGGYGRLVVRGTTATIDLRHGDSLASDGVCLTVTQTDGETIAVDVVAETLRRTTLGLRRPGDRINLERAVAAGTRLDGHIVQGHIDGTARLAERIDEASGSELGFVVDAELGRYVAPKGSIALDGVSLTVVEVLDLPDSAQTSFTVALIPTTLAVTSLGEKRPEEFVNVEVDVVAKYVERLTAAQIAHDPSRSRQR